MVFFFFCVRPETAMDSRFHKVEPMLGERAVHRQPTHCFWGLLKTVPVCLLDRKCPCVNCIKFA